MTKLTTRRLRGAGLLGSGLPASALSLLAAWALILAVAWPLAAPTVARQPNEAQTEVHRGSLLYQIHCRSCHGKHGSGRGPLAKELRVRPSNLRTIAARNDGEFPAKEMFEVIEGARFVRGHGEREMPVWGLTFVQRDVDTDQTADVRAQIEALVAFLESIQRD